MPFSFGAGLGICRRVCLRLLYGYLCECGCCENEKLLPLRKIRPVGSCRIGNRTAAYIPCNLRDTSKLTDMQQYVCRNFVAPHASDATGALSQARVCSRWYSTLHLHDRGETRRRGAAHGRTCVMATQSTEKGLLSTEGATQNTEQGLLSTEKGQHRVRRRVYCVRDRSLRDHHWQMTERSKWAAMLGGLLVTRHAKCRKHAHGVMASASPSRAREAIRLQYNCTTSRITCTRFCQRHTR